MFSSSSCVVRQLAIATLLLTVGQVERAEARTGVSDAVSGEPANAKARKTFDEALQWQKIGDKAVAIEAFRKANAQDGGQCIACLQRAYALATEIGEFKEASVILQDWMPLAKNDAARATLQFNLGMILVREGLSEKKEKCFTQSCDAFKSSLAKDPTLAASHYGMGVALAHLHQDDAARAEFKAFLTQDKDHLDLHPRAERYMNDVNLARAVMAPPFSIVTLRGEHISMDDLTGKVVLIDFWATWCGPCRQALPRIRRIAQEFQGKPFVVLSVSLDANDAKWKDFVEKNEMTWLQYRDGPKGPLGDLFGVYAIPATFSIDADGVLEDQHVGDASIEGKLKRLIAHAAELQKQAAPQSAANAGSAGSPGIAH
jgi:thiol-disulfide isomerase/thioredoxin